MKNKKFYDFFKIEKPYKRTITIISVGYHEGRILIEEDALLILIRKLN